VARGKRQACLAGAGSVEVRCRTLLVISSDRGSLAVWPGMMRSCGGRCIGVVARLWGFGCLRWCTSIGEKNGAAMAQKIQTLFIDDIDGSEAEGTVRFALDGAEYEIDLSAEHARALRDALAPFVAAARRAGGSARRPTRSGRRTPAGGLNTTEVREWAKAQGIEVKDRGRIPAGLVVQFKAASGK